MNFGDLLDALLGRGTPPAGDHDAALRLLAAGRRGIGEKPPSRRAISRAMRIFRARAASARGLLTLVLDTFLAPAPALRSAAPTRFVKFEGEITLEIQITAATRGVDLRGQITPADAAREIVVAGTRPRRAKVAATGTFLLRGLPRGRITLEIGSTRVQDLDL